MPNIPTNTTYTILSLNFGLAVELQRDFTMYSSSSNYFNGKHRLMISQNPLKTLKLNRDLLQKHSIQNFTYLWK